jgi:twitching motility protein PilT
VADAMNQWVLDTSVQHGWLDPDMAAQIAGILLEHPEEEALAYLERHGLVPAENIEWMRSAQSHVTRMQASAAEQAAGGAYHYDAANLRHVNDYLRLAQEVGASDLHLGVSMPPFIRKYGTLQPLFQDAPALVADQTERLAFGFLDEVQQTNLRNRGDADFCYAPEELGRFRTSVVRQRRGYDMVFRVINTQVKTMDDLGLPSHLKELTKYHNGLVLVTGAVGSGKSTTLASFIDEVNTSRRDHIITLEDPIEYKFAPKGCQVTQREIHSHTKSFATALRASLREDPDVIMVGEMRDLETIQLAITASETGHLVLATLHTANASRTLDRVLDVFPIDQRDQIRTMVSESLRGIISQQLVPRADGKGRALALEILVNTPAVAALIRDGKTFMLPGVIQTGRRQGMRLMDDSLMELLQAGTISAQEAWERSDNKKLFEPLMRGASGRN